MKSHGDKTNDVGSRAAQLSGIAQKVAVCLSPASLSFYAFLFSVLSGWPPVSPSLLCYQLCIVFAIPYEYEVLLGAQLGAQLLTLLDLCRYHL